MDELKPQRPWARRKSIFVIAGAAAVVFGFQNCGTGFDVANLAAMNGTSLSSTLTTKTCTARSPAGEALIRKLNKAELNNSLQDLLAISGDFTSSLPSDSSDLNGFTNNAENLQIDSDYMYSLLGVAERAVSAALTKTGSTFLQCTGGQNAACAKLKLSELAKKAYRRPISATEEAKVMAIFTSAQAQALSFQESLGLAMQRIFLSPAFLYRTSYSGPVYSGAVQLSQHELATRIAYFLWSSAPDSALLAAADSNRLGTAEEIRSEVRRLLLDPKADRFIRNFTNEWLGMQKLQAANRDGLTDQLKKDMQEETARLMLSIMRDDRSALDVIAADYSFLNANLATHYGIPGVTGTELRKVDFAPLKAPRRGVLTQGSLLTLTSSPTETKPVGRGAQVLNGVTCNPPPPFPDGLTVTPLADGGAGTLSLKERMEKHRQVGSSCYSCHKEMDPVGMGLESYDQIGRHRTRYPSGNTVEDNGIIRGVAFKNGMELIDFIVQQNDFKRCITKKLMGYAIGRSMTSADQCAVEAIGEEFVVKGKTFSDLVTAIVLSDQFRFNQTASRGE